ncbi:MAG: phosphatase PAP2 family protein [Desulfuromonadaceae bacterium]|nr:phosphatase PAP2 family protein [Desulfuromonadaceae bacterium]MDD2854804.1 phosphatase PAP2 family protein [Desulfuromonadaceae bacterium]
MSCFKIRLKISRICILIILFSSLIEFSAVAGEKSGDFNEKTNGDSISTVAKPDCIDNEYIYGYLDDTGRLLASPTSWGGNDWLTATLIVGATSGVYFADGGVRNFAQRNQSSVGDDFAAVGNAVGNPLIIMPSLGLFYLYGKLNYDPIARRAALLAAESLTISAAFATALKIATQRPRPFTGESPKTWDGPGLKSLNSSFPSIHTQSAFSVASVIAEEYGANPLIPPLAYGLATLTSLSRVYDNKHWASDVFLGGAIGYFVGKAVVRYHSQTSNSKINIIPIISQQGVGITAEYRF